MVPLTLVGVVIADVSDGFPHHLLVVHIGSGCDLTTEQHHAGLTYSLCVGHRTGLSPLNVLIIGEYDLVVAA